MKISQIWITGLQGGTVVELVWGRGHKYFWYRNEIIFKNLLNILNVKKTRKEGKPKFVYPCSYSY